MGKPESGAGIYERFVEELLARGGPTVKGAGTEAYMATHPKSSKKNAAVRSCDWLSLPRVRRMLNEAKLAQTERTQISADKILNELMLIARADISQAFNKNGTLKPIHEIPEELRRAISGVEVLDTIIGKGVKNRVSKVKFWDKVAALGLLGKNLKLFTEKVELSGTVKTVRVQSNVGPEPEE